MIWTATAIRANGNTNDHLQRKFSITQKTTFGNFSIKLVDARKNIISKLNFYNWFYARCAHAHRRANDVRLLYWSKVPGTEDAKRAEPSSDYVLPLGKANIVLHADQNKMNRGESCCVITYGMGVYWARSAAKRFQGNIEIIDLRTLFPLDEELVFSTVKKHGKCLVLTEEQQNNSFAEALAARISKECFPFLDAPVEVLGAMNLPAVPLNILLENQMLPDVEKVSKAIIKLLNY